MLHTLLLLLLVASIAVTVLVKDLIKSAIALASASVVLSILFYQMLAPYAAVVELSIGAGLITVLFVSAISLVGQVRGGTGNEQ